MPLSAKNVLYFSMAPMNSYPSVTLFVPTTRFLMELTDLRLHFSSESLQFLWKPFSLLTLSLLSSTLTLNLPLPRISSPFPPNPDQNFNVSVNLLPFLPNLSNLLSQFLRFGSPISNMASRRYRFLWRSTSPRCWPVGLP